MSWMATERFEARTAPGGLALVQELVNTHAVARGGEDLLAGAQTAEPWLRGAAAQWARECGLEPPDLSLSPDDLPVLRELRDTVRALLEIAPAERPTGAFQADGLLLRAPAQLASDRAGRVTMMPLGTDAGWLVSAVWSQILLAQRDGTWSQVKLCREVGCRSAFFDGSRNGSAIWHNVRTCGNVANLRASRARRRSSGSPGAESPEPGRCG